VTVPNRGFTLRATSTAGVEPHLRLAP
jgi:hypothetical protein